MFTVVREFNKIWRKKRICEQKITEIFQFKCYSSGGAGKFGQDLIGNMTDRRKCLQRFWLMDRWIYTLKKSEKSVTQKRQPCFQVLWSTCKCIPKKRTADKQGCVRERKIWRIGLSKKKAEQLISESLVANDWEEQNSLVSILCIPCWHYKTDQWETVVKGTTARKRTGLVRFLKDLLQCLWLHKEKHADSTSKEALEKKVTGVQC